MVPGMVGVELRTSRQSAWVQARQRGDAVIVGEVVMLDVATSDALTSNYTTTNGKTTLGSRTTASSQLATVIPATDALAHGRVGVSMKVTADDAIGLYEFGEVGDGSHGDVIVQALVLGDAANVAGVALEVDVAASVGRFTLKSAGATFATLLEDAGTSGANVLAWVILHTGGKGGGGGSSSVPSGSEDDVIVLGPGGTSFVAVAPAAAIPAPLYNDGLIGVAVGDGPGPAGLLTQAESLALLDALVYDDTAWSALTTYAPNTLVKKSGSDTIYLQADTVDSLNDDPASGAPWEVFAEEAAAGGGSPESVYFVREMFPGTTSTIFTGTAITSGTAGATSGFGASGKQGVVTMSSSGSAGSGYRFQTVLAAFEAGAGLFFSCRFYVPTDHTDKTLRIGFHDSSTISAPTDGCYIQVVAGTATVYSVSAGTPTADGATYSVAAATWYDATIYWTTAASVVVSMRATGGAMLDTRTITADLPSGSQQFGAGFQCWTPTGTATVVAHLDDMAYGILASHTP